MLVRDRQRQVLAHLRVHGSGNVIDLAAALGVSASTVRRDLSDLSARGLLTRVHGGASLEDGQPEAQRAARSSSHREAKQRIGEAAAKLVEDGDTVLISGGTTTEAMLPHLARFERLTVVTNGLAVAYQLSRHESIGVVVLGGVLRHVEMSLLGPLAEAALSDFHVDIAFCGAFGIDAYSGVSGADLHEVGTDRRLLASARRLVVLVDSSKFGQRGPVRLAETSRISCLITDDGAPAEAVAALRAAGVEVQLC